MDEGVIQITIEESGERIDALLARILPQYSRSQIQKCLDSGAVLLDGRPLKKNYRGNAGDVIELFLPETQDIPLEAQNIPLDVVYEDADIIVINKPRGMVVHPAPGHPDGTLVNALMYHCGDSLSGIGGERRPGIVHRIDKDTSGLLIAAKNDMAHTRLSAQLKDHTLARTYECIVCGNVRQDVGTIDAPIGRSPADRKKMAVVTGGRPAVTHFEVIARYPGYTHLRCRLETGRTHQIRVHLSWQNHPILGDTVYGHKKAELGMDSQCLHAKELTFLHPRTGERVTVSCELPDYFRSVLEKLKKQI